MNRKNKIIITFSISIVLLIVFFIIDVIIDVRQTENIDNESIPISMRYNNKQPTTIQTTNKKLKNLYKNINTKIMVSNIESYCLNFFDVYNIDIDSNSYMEISDIFLGEILSYENMWFNDNNLFDKFVSNKNVYYNDSGLSVVFTDDTIKLVNGLSFIDINNKKFDFGKFSWSDNNQINFTKSYGIIETSKNNNYSKLYLFQNDSKNNLYITIMPVNITNGEIFYDSGIVDVKYGIDKKLFKDSIVNLIGSVPNNEYKLVSLPELNKLFEEAESYIDITDKNDVDDILKRIAIEIEACHFEIPETDTETRIMVETSINKMLEIYNLSKVKINNEDGD